MPFSLSLLNTCFRTDFSSPEPVVYIVLNGTRGSDPEMAPRKKTYTEDQLQKALSKIRGGELSQKKAAKHYGIPVMTLSDHMNGKRQGTKPGPQRVMPPEMEAAFSQKLADLADQGFGLTKRIVKVKAAEFCRKANIPTPFKEESPAGQTWYRNFMKRHPELTLRTPSKLSTNRGCAMDRQAVADYFVDAEKYTTNVEPQHIWNMDESGFNLEHNPIKVVCKKGVRAVNSRVSSSRQNVTVLACVNAAGSAMPPLFIAKGKTHKALQTFNTTDAPPNSVWTWQSKAWMEDSLGVQWFREVFLKHCGQHRPQIVFLDQHHSHEAYELLELAVRERIHLLSFPPHTSHWLQPLDKSCFSALSKQYQRACSEYMAASKFQVVNKASFARLFCQAWGNSMTAENVRSGFRVTGIYPFNPSAIPDQAFSAAIYGSGLSGEAVSTGDRQPATSNQLPASDSADTAADQLPASDSAGTAADQLPASDSADTAADQLPASDSADTAADQLPASDSADTAADQLPASDSAGTASDQLPATTDILHTITENFFPEHSFEEYTNPDVSEVVDMADTEIDVFVNQLMQQSSATPEDPQPSSSTSISPPEPQPSTSWYVMMQDVLDITKGKGKGTAATKKTVPIVHRVLTSEAVLDIKRKEQEEKEKKLKEKEQKKQKREAKKEENQSKKLKRSGETRKGKGKGKSVVNGKQSGICFICATRKDGTWIQCETCQRWLHQFCVPLPQQEAMKAAIERNIAYTCHLCLYF